MTLLQVIQEYRKVLEEMEMGNLPRVAQFAEELREGGEQDREIETLRRLLVVRLSYKQGNAIEAVEGLLQMQLIFSPFVNAEVLFVQGLHFFHTKKFVEGAKKFKQASEIYFQLSWADRAVLSLFNELIGELNAGLLTQDLEESRITYLERLANHHECPNVLGLILRHKSWYLEKLGRYQGAESVMHEALPLLKRYSPISDYQMGVLQDCYLLFKNGKLNEAKQQYESLLGPYDSRLDFPRAFVKALLYGDSLPQPDRFTVMSPVWRDRFDQRNSSAADSPIKWDMDRGILETKDGKEILVKRDSIEGRLLQFLLKGRRTKAELYSLLWPEQADSLLVVDRLNKVISRLRTKAPDLLRVEANSVSLS